MSGVVILYSGGADSRLMLELAKGLNREIFCLLIEYGQKHRDELVYAEEQLKKEGVEYQNISLIGFEVRSALTSEAIAYEGVSDWYVPSRNLIFVSLAASYAESKGFEEIWYGANYSDRVNLFPDCYQEWVVKVNETLKINASRPIKLVAPLLGFTKNMILEYLEKVYNVKKNQLFSGYGGLENEQVKS